MAIKFDPKFFPRYLLMSVHPTMPRVAILSRPFTFKSPSLGLIRVEAGFVTDYASVPRVFWSIYPPDGEYRPAAVVHDWLYWNGSTAQGGKSITRAQADAVFLEAMTALKIPWIRRQILYRSVRLGGWLVWRRRKPRHKPLNQTKEPA